MRLSIPRHCTPHNVGVRAQPSRAKNTKGNSREDTLFSVDDALPGGDAKQLAAQIQESLLSSETMVSTSADSSGGRKGSFVASSAPEWLDVLELEDLELEEDLFEREEAADEGAAVGIDPSTGLSAGWSVSVPGQDKNPEQLPSAGWSVTAVGDSDFEPDEGSLQTSSRAMRKVMNASKAQETVDAKQQTVGQRSAAHAEASLKSLKAHEVRQALKDQEEADHNARLQKPAEVKKRRLEHQRHLQLKIISGVRAGTRLYSPAGLQTRPMMEKVRGALFSMLLAGSAGRYTFPAASRWLDLYAGTGAIGLEALSRGCGQAHFVELDPWVVKKCLSPNIRASKMNSECVVHQVKAEVFLRRGLEAGSFAGGAFDFVSITPPYMLVSYPEIYDLLENSPLLHERSVVIVEYAKQNIKDIRRHVGSLSLLKSRRYGRTYIAIYGNVGDARV